MRDPLAPDNPKMLALLWSACLHLTQVRNRYLTVRRPHKLFFWCASLSLSLIPLGTSAVLHDIEMCGKTEFMSVLSLFTAFHVFISLVGIASGAFLLFGLLTGKLLRRTAVVFLITTIATSVTGFFFPFKGMTPAIIFSIVTIPVLILAAIALRKDWEKTFVLTSAFSEYLNVVVLITQLFLKVAPLHALAPTGKEPVVAVIQLLNLATFIAVSVIAVKRVRLMVFSERSMQS